MEINTLLEQFKGECQVIEFKYEYPGYIGYEQYGIITELSESELTKKYEDIIKEFIPYLVLDSTYKKIRDEFRKNERKHGWRAANTIDAFNYEDGEMESHHPELIGESLEEKYLRKNEMDIVYESLELLTKKQKRRIIDHYLCGYTVSEIAVAEGLDHTTVQESIDAGIKKLKKILKTPPKSTSPTGNK